MHRKLFALSFSAGLLFLLAGGYYFIQSEAYNAVPSVPLTPTSSTSFSYGPGPTGNEKNPLAVDAILYPLANNTGVSYLYLSVFGGFVAGPPQITFIFESTFNATILRDNNGSGDGVGIWKTYPYQSSNGKPGTTIIYQFNLTTSNPEYQEDNITSFTGTTATVEFTGLPFTSEPGVYNFVLPFNSNEPANGPDDDGFVTLCAPSDFLLTSSNENYTSGYCSGPHEGYEFRINQSEQLAATVQNLSAENGYATSQTRALFFLALGVSTLITSATFLDSRVDRLIREAKNTSQPSERPNMSSKGLARSYWDILLTFVKIFGGLFILFGLSAIGLFVASRGASEGGVPDLTYFTFVFAIIAIGWSMIQAVQYYRDMTKNQRQIQDLTIKLSELKDRLYPPEDTVKQSQTAAPNVAIAAPQLTKEQKDRRKVSTAIKMAAIGALAISGIAIAIALYSLVTGGVHSDFFLLDYPVGVSTLMVGLSLLVAYYSDRQIHAHLDENQKREVNK